MANSYGRQVVLTLTNKSGGGVVAGDVVIIDTGNDGAFTTTTSAQSQKSLGVVQETIANNASGRVLVAGYAALVNVQASVTRGHYAETYTVAKQANGNSTRRAGSFGQFLTGGTTPTAWLWGFPDNSGAAGSTVATDTVWDTAGDMVIGTGADTAHKLAAGSANARLVSAGAADPVWTSFPKASSLLTSGDVTISATTNVYASNVTGLSDLTLACATGDYIEAGISAIAPNTTGQSMKFDICTVVSAAAVNFFSTRSGTGAGNGCVCWYCVASVIAKAGGSVLYVAQSGDISGGNIVLRALCFVSASTRVVGASTTNPLLFWARNLRQ